ncbi:hypothetical protein U9M48_037428, partial [Paspalum notatum var. saurae]
LVPLTVVHSRKNKAAIQGRRSQVPIHHHFSHFHLAPPATRFPSPLHLDWNPTQEPVRRLRPSAPLRFSVPISSSHPPLIPPKSQLGRSLPRPVAKAVRVGDCPAKDTSFYNPSFFWKLLKKNQLDLQRRKLVQ